jgi:hypothetical protein
MKNVIIALMLTLSIQLFAQTNSNPYQTSRRILADDVPVKAIAKVSEKDVEYLFWYSLFSTGAYDTNVEIVKKVMQYRKEDGEEYTGIGRNGFPAFDKVQKLSKKQGQILRFLCECEIHGRRGKSVSDFKVWLMDQEEYLEEDIGKDQLGLSSNND